MLLKLSNTVAGDGDTVQMPPETNMLDWEVELAAVIGTRARRIPVEDALSIIACYTVINDVSARDMNVRTDYPFKHSSEERRVGNECVNTCRSRWSTYH